jgi:hypothetical protein
LGKNDFADVRRKRAEGEFWVFEKTIGDDETGYLVEDRVGNFAINNGAVGYCYGHGFQLVVDPKFDEGFGEDEVLGFLQEGFLGALGLQVAFV